MANKTVITKNAPSPIGPYSQAVWSGNTLYLSGQIAINAESGELVIGLHTSRNASSNA